MKRVATAAATGLLFTAGCGANAEPINYPDHIPEAVNSALQSTLKVAAMRDVAYTQTLPSGQIFKLPSITGPETIRVATGVKIDDTSVLTAGHVTREPNSKGRRPRCGDLLFLGQFQNDALATSADPIGSSVKFNSSADYGFYDVQPDSRTDNFSKIPNVAIGPSAHIGEKVYISSYQQGDNRINRGPGTALHGAAKKAAYPTIIGAVVIGLDSKRNMLDLATAPDKAFAGQDATVKQGASGGPVLDGDGKLIGITADIHSNTTVQDFETISGIQTPYAGTTKINFVGAQVVSKSLIDTARYKARHADCPKTPPIVRSLPLNQP